MITCPNKNLKSWKNLVKARGENEAYNLWFLYKGIVPQEEYVTEEIVEPSPVVEEPIAEPTFMRVPQANPISLEEEQEYIPENTKTPLKPSAETLFGETSSTNQLEFHINTLNTISDFLNNLGVDQRLVNEFLDKDGKIVENAVAAANFIEGTIDIIEDIEKRPTAWNKLPEEAAHWWYRLLKIDNPLKQSLWEAAKNSQKLKELQTSNYGNYNDLNELTEEAIGQLIAESIKKIENNTASKEERNFIQKFFDFIKELITKYQENIETPFDIAATKILASDISDLLTLQEYNSLMEIANPESRVNEISDNVLKLTEIEPISETSPEYMEYLLNTKFKVKTRYLNKTLKKLEGQIANQTNALTTTFSKDELDTLTPLKLTFFSKFELFEKYKKGISLSSNINLTTAKGLELKIINKVREDIKKENPNLKTITPEEFIKEIENYLNTIYNLKSTKLNSFSGYRISNIFSDFSDLNHIKIGVYLNDEYFSGGHFGKSPFAWYNITPFNKTNEDKFSSVLLHEFQTDFLDVLDNYNNASSGTTKNSVILNFLLKGDQYFRGNALQTAIINKQNYNSSLYGEFEHVLDELSYQYNQKSVNDALQNITLNKNAIDDLYTAAQILESFTRREPEFIKNLIGEYYEIKKKNYDPNSYKYSVDKKTVLNRISEKLIEKIKQDYTVDYSIEYSLSKIFDGALRKSFNPNNFISNIGDRTKNNFFKTDLARLKNNLKLNYLSYFKIKKGFERYEKMKNLSESQFKSIYNNLTQSFSNLSELFGLSEDDTQNKITSYKEFTKIYLTPLIHDAIQKSLISKSKPSDIRFAGGRATILTQGNWVTAELYAGPEEVFQGTDEEKLNILKEAATVELQDDFSPLKNIMEQILNSSTYEEAKKIWRSDMKKSGVQGSVKYGGNSNSFYANVYKIAGNNFLEVGALYTAFSKTKGVNLIYENTLGLVDNTPSYKLDLSQYKLNSPILFGINNNQQSKEASITEEPIVQENTALANQVNNNAKEQINEELNNKLQEIVEKLGFTVEALDTLTDKNGQPLDAVAKVDILNKIIQYSEGKADISTMPEETAHIFIELMGEEHPLVQKMLNEIESFDIYQEVLDEYGSDPEYLNEDGTQNILKLKKEAIGKLVAAKIVDQFQDSSKENERKATNWFNAIITKLKELFKGLGILGANELVNKAKGKNLNAFEETAAKILSGNIKGLKKTGAGVYYQKSAPSQVEVAKSYLDAQAKIIKDESKETDRYTVNGESGYTSATEISHAEFRKKNPNYVATKEDEATKNMGILTHIFQADYIAEMFPEYNKHVKRLTTAEKAKYARFIAITREGLKGIVEEAKKNGSIMIAELLVANTKTKIAGTIDILEIKLDGKAKIYDLKTRKSKEVYQKKLDEFGVQLNEYRKILQKGDPNLGTIPLTVDKTRFIGARVTFLKGTTIPGNLVFDKDKRGKILGRPTAYEKTGISEIDKLTAKLTSQVELLETKLQGASKEQKDIIKSQIANKRKIIEEIQITESISSIIEEAGADLRNIEGLLLNETYDPTTDFKDLEDTLTLYSMMHQFIPTAMMEKMSKTEKFQIDFLVGKSKALQDSLNRLVEDAVKQAVLTTNIVGQGDIKTIEDVMGAQKNVSLWKRWFTGISFSTHPLLITVKKLVDKALNVSRNKLNGLKEEIKIATDKLIAATGRSGLDVFDPFYQKLEDGTLTGDLVDEFRPEFYKERAKAKREKNLKWYETNTTFDKEKYLKWFENKKKFLQGIESLEKARIKEAFLHPDSKTDEKVKNSEELLNKAVNKAYETKVKRELEEWVAANKDNIYEFNKPKNQWKDARYTAVQNNPALKEYYDLYKRVMEEIQEFLPQDVKRNFIPNFSVDFVELAARVGLSEASKTLKDSTLNSLDLTYDEARYGKTSSITGENINSIPIQGLTKLTVGEKSLDLSQILAKFAESAYRYKELSGIENSVLMISNYVNGQEVLKLSALGEPILDKYNQIKSELTKKTASDQLKDYIDNIFYNKKRNADVGFETESGKTISLNKVGDKVLGYTALNNLALNLFAPVVNSIQGNVTAVIQSAKGQFFSTGNYMEALGLSATQNKKAQLFLKKFGSTMGEFDNEDYSDLSVLMSKKVLKQDHAFSLMKIGEHQVQHDVLLAMLLSNKHAINYSDYDVVNGKLVWVNKTKKEPSSEEISAFEQKVLKVNKLVVGNNDSDDMMAIKKTFAGRALVQHRGWLPAMAEERFSKRRYDHDLQMWMEGRYVTLWNATLKPLYNLVFRQRNDFKNWWSSMDDTQKANMKANFMEMALIGAVLLIGAGLHGDDDDKERRRDLAYLIRVNNRVYSELTFFSNMTSAYQILISPAAAISTVQNAGKVFSNTYNFIQEQDEKSGQKALKSTLKMLPPLGALEKAWNVKRDYIDR